MDQIRAEVAKWLPPSLARHPDVRATVEEGRRTTLPAKNPRLLVWCMGARQHTSATLSQPRAGLLNLLPGNAMSVTFAAAPTSSRGSLATFVRPDSVSDIVTFPGSINGLVEAHGSNWSRGILAVDYDLYSSRFDELPGKAGRPARTGSNT